MIEVESTPRVGLYSVELSKLRLNLIVVVTRPSNAIIAHLEKGSN